MRPANRAASTEFRLRRGAWYGDELVALSFPRGWRVACFWPPTPRPLSEEQIAEALERPIGQPPVSDLARGRSRPLVIVDDLTRPTPSAQILPVLLRQFEAAGIIARDVTILMATGAHGRPAREAIQKKVGGEAASACRLLVHDPAHDVVTVGRTSFGTPVIVNREVVASDLLVGIGGVYPQYTAGFGGGSKLAIGVLGLPSIVKLHYGHPRVEGSYDVDNEFRRDLDEIARMIGLQTVISVHVDAAREIVRVVSGDHFSYYREAARFSADTYSVPAPGNADVVISNSYPADVSLTFVRSKGMIPLFQASARASRVVLAACSEGAGHHQLFPFTASRFQRQIHLGRAAVARPGDIPAKVARRLRTSLGSLKARTRSHRDSPKPTEKETAQRQAWLYLAPTAPVRLPQPILGMRPSSSWEEIVDAVSREQGGRQELDVVIYPCAPLQVLKTGSQSVTPRLQVQTGA